MLAVGPVCGRTSVTIGFRKVETSRQTGRALGSLWASPGLVAATQGSLRYLASSSPHQPGIWAGPRVYDWEILH